MRKSILISMCLIALSCSIYASPSKETMVTDSSTLIVYFSWSNAGNTEKLARYIQQETGGAILRLEPKNSYPRNYEKCGEVALEERDTNARPEISNLPSSMDRYDRIIICYPIWWHTAPMIIGTFLESYDLSGIGIYPFSQSASMNVEQFNNSMEFVRANAGNGIVHEGLFAKADNQSAIHGYIVDNLLR